jgi:hypothetical protein
MPNITTIDQFKKANELNIPLATAVPNSSATMATPNNTSALTLLITKTEKSVLINALGLATYNTLQLALTGSNINLPEYASYKKLVQGDEYDGKLWNGLDYDYGLLQNRIFELFVTETNSRLSAVGDAKVNPQGANLHTPAYKIANANANFIKQYQGGYLTTPIVYNDGEFIDWVGCDDEVEVSLYRYLIDKKADFVDWSEENFKALYDTKNSFGI